VSPLIRAATAFYKVIGARAVTGTKRKRTARRTPRSGHCVTRQWLPVSFVDYRRGIFVGPGDVAPAVKRLQRSSPLKRAAVEL